MGYSSSFKSPLRCDFGKIQKVMDIPSFIQIQKESYEKFLQKDILPEEREDIGLQSVFKSVFPIEDFNKTASFEFVKYAIGEPKYEIDDCRQRGMTYAAPLKVTIRLIIWDVDREIHTRNINSIKEQEVYFGEIPLMTESGTFIINGTERVIVNQLHRSPGIFFDFDKNKTHSGRHLYTARIIPHRGSWIDFEFDSKDILYIRIDRRRKFPVTVLLKALGLTSEEILNLYCETFTVTFEGDEVYKIGDPEIFEGYKAIHDIVNPNTHEVIVKSGRKIQKAQIKKMRESGVSKIQIEIDDIVGSFLVQDIKDAETGEILFPYNVNLTKKDILELKQKGIKEFRLLFTEGYNIDQSIHSTLMVDKLESKNEAVVEIYRRLRPNDPPVQETANNFFENLFFNLDTYDLSFVGRLKMNYRLKLNIPISCRVLTKEDIIEAVRNLVQLKSGHGVADDIDNLGNRRVRSVGELVENQYRIGLVRMERAIKERMSIQDVETLMPHDVMNAKPVTASIKEFFGTSQLSQFMDQTNPLSEVTHKRRLSALGPGGLTRERAGFEVRDVHATHYGRICP
ncbi:MAG: DNA-directed RNA polymerase subunit beta, partial [Thermodesulfobacteriota bacterium]|nr:DNA-directed RNA polymerase subunit beta [Thermodesulfobacteriota bacterium]